MNPEAIPAVAYLIFSIICLIIVIAWIVLPFTVSSRLGKLLAESKKQTEQLELIAAYTKRAAQAADPSFKPDGQKGVKFISGR